MSLPATCQGLLVSSAANSHVEPLNWITSHGALWVYGTGGRGFSRRRLGGQTTKNRRPVVGNLIDWRTDKMPFIPEGGNVVSLNRVTFEKDHLSVYLLSTMDFFAYFKSCVHICDLVIFAHRLYYDKQLRSNYENLLHDKWWFLARGNYRTMVARKEFRRTRRQAWMCVR